MSLSERELNREVDCQTSRSGNVRRYERADEGQTEIANTLSGPTQSIRRSLHLPLDHNESLFIAYELKAAH